MEKPTQVQHGEDLDGALTKLHGSALGVLWARSLGAHLPLALLIAGTLVLVMRFMGDLGRQEAAYALLLVVLAPVTAWLVARGRVPARADLVAWLDRRSGGTGRILTHFAVGDERWSAMAASDCRRESSTAKPLAPDYSPAAWRSLPAGLFACAALWVSPVSAAAGPPVALFENMLNGLVERLADLEELGLMDDERVEELAERLKEITGGLDEGNLEQALESMERFSEQMDEESGRLADMLAAAREAMESVSPEDQEALAEAFQRMAESFAGSPLAAEAMANAEKLMEGLEGMDMSGLEGLEGLDLSDLSGVQGAMSAELAAKLSEMAQAGFLNQNALAKALARRGKPGNFDKFDFAHADDCESKKGGLWNGGSTGAGCFGTTAGQGAFGRGPGAAEMSYGEETPLQSDAFEAEVLGGDPYMDAANSQLLGLGYVAPEVAPNGQAAGAVQLDASNGHATWRRRLSPNQRAAVRRFFTSPEAPSTATPSDK